MNRSQARLLVNLVFLAFGVWLVYLWDSWTIRGAPVWIAGAIIVVFAVLGFCGVNVFYGGPLDKNKDPK